MTPKLKSGFTFKLQLINSGLKISPEIDVFGVSIWVLPEGGYNITVCPKGQEEHKAKVFNEAMLIAFKDDELYGRWILGRETKTEKYQYLDGRTLVLRVGPGTGYRFVPDVFGEPF